MKRLGSPDNSIEVTAEAALRDFLLEAGDSTEYEPSIGSVVSPVHRGVESACFNVKSGSAELFLKVRFPDMAAFFEERAVDEGARRASDLSVGPRLIKSQPDTGSYLFEHLSDDWHWGKVDDFAKPAVLENTVKAKQILHESEGFGDGKSVFDAIEDYAAIISEQNIAVPKTVNGVLEKTRRSAAAIDAAGVTLKPCHGDGVASNVMISSLNEVKLVDFDSAGSHDPYFDLGSMIVEIAQFPDLARSVLEIYDGQCRETELNRCMLYGIADDLKWALWGFISFKTSQRSSVEFVKYAEWRLLRSICNADGPDFDRWLKTL
jgi:hypothetical protein